jgi:hypothetical protein
MSGSVSSSLAALSPGAELLGPEGEPYVNVPAAAAILSTNTLPGSISGLAQVQIQVSSPSSLGNIFLAVQQASDPTFLVRGPGLLIWAR